MTAETLTCACGHTFDAACGRYGCPNCGDDAQSALEAREDAAARQARSRAARRAAGCSRVSVTLSPEAAAALDSLRKRHGESTVADVIAHALIAQAMTPSYFLEAMKRKPAVADPFGAAFVAGIVPRPSPIAPSSVSTIGLDVGLATTPVRWRDEFAGMPDPLEALRGMPSPADPRKPR